MFIVQTIDTKDLIDFQTAIATLQEAKEPLVIPIINVYVDMGTKAWSVIPVHLDTLKWSETMVGKGACPMADFFEIFFFSILKKKKN